MGYPGYDGMWLPEDQDPRMGRAPARGERETLVEYLEHYRTTLELKCDGLSADQLATRSVPPSNISLLGLLRHMTHVELHWFRRIIGGESDLTRMFTVDDDAGFDLPPVDEALVADTWAAWRGEVANAREVLDRTELDQLVDVHGAPCEVRGLVVHMIEEYARHCGHADLVRECVDGRAGQ